MFKGKLIMNKLITSFFLSVLFFSSTVYSSKHTRKLSEIVESKDSHKKSPIDSLDDSLLLKEVHCILRVKGNSSTRETEKQIKILSSVRKSWRGLMKDPTFNQYRKQIVVKASDFRKMSNKFITWLESNNEVTSFHIDIGFHFFNDEFYLPYCELLQNGLKNKPNLRTFVVTTSNDQYVYGQSNPFGLGCLLGTSREVQADLREDPKKILERPNLAFLFNLETLEFPALTFGGNGRGVDQFLAFLENPDILPKLKLLRLPTGYMKGGFDRRQEKK